VAVRASIEVEEPVLSGQPFRVAVVVDTTSARTIRGVTLLLRGFASLVPRSEQGDKDHRTFGSWTASLAETTRLEPGARRFEGTLLVPGDAPPTGEGVMDVHYALDARLKLEFPWVFDVTASRRITVARAAQAERPAPRPVTVSSTVSAVGRARWHVTWQEEGRRAGLALEGRQMGLHGTLAGAVDARVEPRGNGVEARLSWDSFGIGLSIRPRGLLRGSVSLDAVDPAFGKRFVARGHDPAQVLAALDRDLRAALLAFESVELDDGGAEVRSTTSARDPEALRGLLAELEVLAEAAVAAERGLLAPSWVVPSMEDAWRAFAAETTGRLRAGRMAVTGALVDGDRIDVETRCDGRGRPEATRLTLILDPPADRMAQLLESAGADLRRSVQDRDRACRVEVRAADVVLELAGVTADPAVLRAPMAEMARLARRLRGDTSRGPYR